VFIVREPPLPIAGAAGIGAVADALLAAVRAAPDPSRWVGVAGDGVVVIVGDAIPWVDGAIWLGRDPAAPGLLLPTTSRVVVEGVDAAAWMASRLGLAALLPDARVVPLVGARPVER
jgi:hypothetical protein